MAYQNLEQIRAGNALRSIHRQARPVTKIEVNKLPALIVNHGLLATSALALDKRGGILDAMNAVARHLADERVGRLQPENQICEKMINELTSHHSDSAALQLATAETLEFLAYLKRFAIDSRN